MNGKISLEIRKGFGPGSNIARDVSDGHGKSMGSEAFRKLY